MDRDYEALVRPIERRLVRAVWRVLRNEADADDALQDGLTRVWMRLEQVRRHPNPEALVVRLCLNSAYDILRRRQRRGRSEVVLDAAAHPAGSPSALERIEAQELRSELLRAIGCLSRTQAEAVLLRYADSRSYSEIAAALDCSESTARTHVERGRDRLARILEKRSVAPRRDSDARSRESFPNR